MSNGTVEALSRIADDSSNSSRIRELAGNLREIELRLGRLNGTAEAEPVPVVEESFAHLWVDYGLPVYRLPLRLRIAPVLTRVAYVLAAVVLGLLVGLAVGHLG